MDSILFSVVIVVKSTIGSGVLGTQSSLIIIIIIILLLTTTTTTATI